MAQILLSTAWRFGFKSFKCLPGVLGFFAKSKDSSSLEELDDAWYERDDEEEREDFESEEDDDDDDERCRAVFSSGFLLIAASSIALNCSWKSSRV